MKKLTYLLLFLFTLVTFSSCNGQDPIKSLKGIKPNDYYYTNNLMEKIKLKKITKCTVVEMNFYKELDIDKENYEKICSFFDKLNMENFMSPLKNNSQKPKYKIFFICENEKYVVNIYDNRYISIYPFDGTYSMDYIDLKNIPDSINLYYLCNFLYSL